MSTPQPQIEVGAFYRNTKNNNIYRVLAISKHSETLEDLVIYEAQYDNPMSKVWARPIAMFFEEVERNGIRQPRFERVENAN